MGWEARRKSGRGAFFTYPNGSENASSSDMSERGVIRLCRSMLARKLSGRRAIIRAQIRRRTPRKSAWNEQLPISFQWRHELSRFTLEVAGCRISENVVVEGPEPAPEPEAEIHESTLGEFQALAARADSGNQDAQQSIRKLMDRHPVIWKHLVDL